MLELDGYFGDYFVIDEIASGGMASICLAYDYVRHRFVALKSLFSQYAQDPVFRKRLRREGDIYKSLRHPNIIELLDADYDSEYPYLILEYIHGETLAGLIARHPNGCKLPLAMRILEDIAGSLVQAHALSIIHRDLQPQNVLIDGSGVVKLFDFGIAYAEDDLIRTVTGTIMGTILYSSPEQSEGKEVDERSDLYSLGLVFYEILTGRRAVEGKDLGEVLEKKLTAEIPPPTDFREDIPPELVEIAMKLLNKNPDKRYRSIGALLDIILDLRCDLKGDEHRRLFGSEQSRMLYEAKKACAVGRYDMARKKAGDFARSRGREKAAQHAGLMYLMARLSRARGELDAARDYFDRLLALPAARNEHLLDYATFLHSTGDLDAALSVLSSFTRGAPLGEPAMALKRVIDDQLKKELPFTPVASSRTTPIEEDEFDPGLIEIEKPDDLKSGTAEPAQDKAVQTVEENLQSDDDDDLDEPMGGWRGAIRSWLSKAMDKKGSS